ncbi:MAG TPA: hypothetical protein VE974_18650 [Thermoanaerobaculia bacterium]|nr:hypothetical protein [Thermoanaerobaculia bacterium]
MKTRTTLVAATLLLLTVSAFADDSARAAGDDPARLPGVALRDHVGRGDDADQYDRTPKKPFIFDGVAMPAGTRLPDVSLTWVISKEDHTNGTFHVFTSRDAANSYMQKRTPSGVATDGARPGDVKSNWPGTCSWGNSYSRFEKSRWCGDSTYLSLSPPYGYYSELDSISWNNSISCVYAACDWYWTALYSCRDFVLQVQSGCADPDALLIEGGLIVQDLDNYGFNNRTSSIRFE